MKIGKKTRSQIPSILFFVGFEPKKDLTPTLAYPSL